MAELALDDVDRHSFARKLDGMRVPQLMGSDRRRTPASTASWRSSARAAVADQRRPRVGPSMTQNSGPGGNDTRCANQAASCSNPNWSIPASRRLSPLPRQISSDPRRSSMSVSLSASASEIRSPARHNTAINARTRSPWRSWPAWRITSTISSARGGSGGYSMPLLRARWSEKQGQANENLAFGFTNHRQSRPALLPHSRRPLPAESGHGLRPEPRPDHGPRRRAAAGLAQSQSAFVLRDLVSATSAPGDDGGGSGERRRRWLAQEPEGFGDGAPAAGDGDVPASGMQRQPASGN